MAASSSSSNLKRASFNAFKIKRGGSSISLGSKSRNDPDWKPIGTVVSCEYPTCVLNFKKTRLRHRCNRCGAVVCSSHSEKYLTLMPDGTPNESDPEAKRYEVCLTCFRAGYDDNFVDSNYTEELAKNWPKHNDNLLKNLDEFLVLRVVQESGAKPSAGDIVGSVAGVAVAVTSAVAEADALGELGDGDGDGDGDDGDDGGDDGSDGDVSDGDDGDGSDGDDGDGDDGDDGDGDDGDEEEDDGDGDDGGDDEEEEEEKKKKDKEKKKKKKKKKKKDDDKGKSSIRQSMSAGALKGFQSLNAGSRASMFGGSNRGSVFGANSNRASVLGMAGVKSVGGSGSGNVKLPDGVVPLFHLVSTEKEEIYDAKVLGGGRKIVFHTTFKEQKKTKKECEKLMVMIRQNDIHPKGQYEVQLKNSGRILGYIKRDTNEPLSLRRILITDPELNTIYIAESNAIKTDFSVNFKVRAPDSKDRIGRIQREFTGTSLVSSGHDVYKIRFPKGANRDIKCLIVCAAISIDQIYFDGASFMDKAAMTARVVGKGLRAAAVLGRLFGAGGGGN